MKSAGVVRNVLFAAAVSLLGGCTASGAAGRTDAALRFVTFNIWQDAFGNPVGERRDGVLSTCLRLKGDVLSLQEMSPNWWKSGLVEGLAAAGYETIRGDVAAALARAAADLTRKPDRLGNYMPLVYNAKRLKLLESGLEFFHNDLEYEKGFTWGVFEDLASGRRFAAFATHLWWQCNGRESNAVRELTIRLIIEKMEGVRAKWGGIPVIGGGDLNCTEDDMPALRLFRGRGYSDACKSADAVSAVPSEHADPKRGSDGRYHGTAGVIGRKANFMLDRVFYTKGIHAVRHDVDTDQTALDVSDHSPVVVDFVFEREEGKGAVL